MSSNTEKIRVAVVHDWLVTYAGAERVLEQILLLYPNANLFSLIDFMLEGERGFLLNKKVNVSFLQKMPFAKKKYRNYLPLMPFAIEQFNFSRYDLIISSSHAVAKGVRTGGKPHICYCHTPMRYAWDLSSQYLESTGLSKGVKGMMVKSILAYLRKWDLSTADRVNHFIANSKYIAERIKRIYGRNSIVIYPPVDTDTFTLGSVKEDFYLTASRIVPYKKIDLIVEAFSQMPEKRLVVIGDGPDFAKVKSRAGKNVELLGYQPQDVLLGYMQRAKAFVFAAEEDFGIAPVEAQACGTPVIAYGKGGVLETVIPLQKSEDRKQETEIMGYTGVFFYEQTLRALREVVRSFENNEDIFDCKEIRKNAERFGKERFKREFREIVDRKAEEILTSGINQKTYEKK